MVEIFLLIVFFNFIIDMSLFKPNKITLTPLDTQKNRENQTDKNKIAEFLVTIQIEKITAVNYVHDNYLELENELKMFSESQIDLSYHDPKKKFIYCTYEDGERSNLLYFVNYTLRLMKTIDWSGDVIFIGKFKNKIFIDPVLVNLEFVYKDEKDKEIRVSSCNTYYFWCFIQ